MNFDSLNWGRCGDNIFKLAQEWTLASYRKQALAQLAEKIIPKDTSVANFARIAMQKWQRPVEQKDAIEFDILCATLNPDNYRDYTDPDTGDKELRFFYPEQLAAEINKLQQLRLIDDYFFHMARRAFSEAALPREQRDARRIWL